MEIELFAVIVGCLSLAMKVEETVKKLPDIITCCRTSINQSPINDQKEYKVIKDKIMAVERILLEDLEFNVQIQIPHRWALSLCQTLQATKEIASECWSLCNLSFQGTVVIKYPAHIISTAVVYSSYTLLKAEVPTQLKNEKWLRDHHCPMEIMLSAVVELMEFMKSIQETPDDIVKYGLAALQVKKLMISSPSSDDRRKYSGSGRRQESPTPAKSDYSRIDRFKYEDRGRYNKRSNENSVQSEHNYRNDYKRVDHREETPINSDDNRSYSYKYPSSDRNYSYGYESKRNSSDYRRHYRSRSPSPRRYRD